MDRSYTADQTFKDLDYSQATLREQEYEHCTFRNCTFAKTQFYDSHFLDTEFIDCDLSNAHLGQSLFQQVVFTNCKMLGLPFEECNTINFSVIFNHCQLNHASFYQMPLNRCRFNECQLQGADFTEATLKDTNLHHCDLRDARFDHTNLEKADLSHSFNYAIDPVNNRVKGTRFSFPEVLGLLHAFDIIIDSDDG